jgi:ricin-type beta-trefoil lectin protein
VIVTGRQVQTWTKNGQTLRALGKCLDVSANSSTNGQDVHLWTCHGQANQRWTLPA